MIFINFQNSRQVSALIYQEVDVVFENRKLYDLIVNYKFNLNENYKSDIDMIAKNCKKNALFLHSMLASACRLIPLKSRDRRFACLCLSDALLISIAKQSGTFLQSLVSYINIHNQL